MKHTIAIMLLLLSLGFSTSQAQITSELLGKHIKIEASSISEQSLIGVVTGISSTALLIRHEDSGLTIPIHLIEHLYIKDGKRRRIKLGILGGFLAGTAVGIALPKEEKASCTDCLQALGSLSNTADIIFGAAIGSVAGAFAGFFIRTDRWERIPMKISFTSAPARIPETPFNPMVSFKFSLGK